MSSRPKGEILYGQSNEISPFGRDDRTGQHKNQTRYHTMTSIVCKDLCKTFQQGDETIIGLDNVSITIERGDFVCLSGPSGSGKTTLL
ncbi:MAG: ATP-binding cassette domain-containing protein, partial [Gammaproteobacteria bacterium]|nr:ATP-binding cassette domain-containing protein [Gammaproteobacteria bacterium]